jgi:adsorption protein B
MDYFSASAILVTSGLLNLSSFDDAFVDLLAVGIRRRRSGQFLASAGKPTIGVLIANWHEEEILERMIEGNLARIAHPNVCFYLGVYPNDDGTRDAAFALERRHPGRVVAIVNTMPGPTSKGQMLNEMFRRIYSDDDGGPELAVLHDSEDIIDPRTFDVYAVHSLQHDFIQVPVFSLDSRHRTIVAETYMDEFAERHTREMIVRNAVGAAIPSAGVGTCLSQRLIRHFVRKRGHVLMTGCVTEDYILGVEAKRAGFKCCFAAVSCDDHSGHDYVATREYFPKTLASAIKQKTRWMGLRHQLRSDAQIGLERRCLGQVLLHPGPQGHGRQFLAGDLADVFCSARDRPDQSGDSVT